MYRWIRIDKDLIRKYKSPDNMLRHLDPDDEGYMILKGDDMVGYVAWDGTCITALEVAKSYQGQGWSSHLLSFAVNHGCDTLTVNRSNKNAIEIYKHLGWKHVSDLNPKMMVFKIMK